LGGLQARAATALWTEELGARRTSAGERRSRRESEVQNPRSTRSFKGYKPDPSLSMRGRRDSRTPAHSCARPGETTVHSRNASVSVEYGRAESAHSHYGAVTSVTSAEMLTPITTPTLS
jgi:hypothetical protein